jgi:VWFA-related protein
MRRAFLPWRPASAGLSFSAFLRWRPASAFAKASAFARSASADRRSLGGGWSADRRSFSGGWLAGLTLLFLSGAISASGSRPPQQPTVRTGTAGVLIDVSVVDAKGRPVVDISPDDFELTEDGKRQQIVSATLVQGGAVRPLMRSQPDVSTTATQPSPGSANQAGLAADPTLSVTAILFDRLSPEARPLAFRAALASISTLSPPHDYAAVFLADVALRTFQSFTTQQELLRQGLDRLAATAPTTLNPTAERARNTRTQQIDPNVPPTAGAEASGGWVSVGERERRLNTGGPEGALLRLELRMEESYGQFLAEYAGQASLAGLRAVVASLGALPGRKSIVYFTEDLPITSRLKPQFDALIGEANRANITVYPVDAVGLRVHSSEAALNRNVSVAGAQGIGDANRGEGPYTKELERQEQLLTSRSAAVLGRLAKETGGFLLDNTNDLAAGVGRMQQERTTYYLLGYQSTNAALDGKFRKVSVKVKRPKVTIRARPGYVASPAQP